VYGAEDRTGQCGNKPFRLQLFTRYADFEILRLLIPRSGLNSINPAIGAAAKRNVAVK